MTKYCNLAPGVVTSVRVLGVKAMVPSSNTGNVFSFIDVDEVSPESNYHTIFLIEVHKASATLDIAVDGEHYMYVSLADIGNYAVYPHASHKYYRCDINTEEILDVYDKEVIDKAIEDYCTEYQI